jgi:hypothetical protein
VLVAARAGRFGLVLALLLVLLGVSVTAVPGTGTGDAGQHRVSVIGESASAISIAPSTAPSSYDDLQDWLRLSAGAPRALATAMPDTWWVVCPRATGGCAPQGRMLFGEVDSLGMATAAPTSRSSRAPPFA